MKHADRQRDGWANTTFLLCINSESIKRDVTYNIIYKYIIGFSYLILMYQKNKDMLRGTVFHGV
jgi:hypothetical protein